MSQKKINESEKTKEWFKWAGKKLNEFKISHLTLRMSQKILRKVNKQLKWVRKSILIKCEVNSQLNESENLDVKSTKVSQISK